jgi:hypothetical protein
MISLDLELQVHHRDKSAVMIGKGAQCVVEIAANRSGRPASQSLYVLRKVIILHDLKIAGLGRSIIKWPEAILETAARRFVCER